MNRKAVGKEMRKRKKKFYFDSSIVFYLGAIALIFYFFYAKWFFNKIETQGIPIKCTIVALCEEEDEPIEGQKGVGYHYVTTVEYCIDGKTYFDTDRGHLGEVGDIIEMVYLPSNLKNVYSLSVVASRSRIMNVVGTGVVIFAIFLKFFLDYIFKHYYKHYYD